MFSQHQYYLKTTDNNVWYFMYERIKTLRQIKGVFSSLQFSGYCVLKGKKKTRAVILRYYSLIYLYKKYRGEI